MHVMEQSGAMQAMVEAQVFGVRGQWERHEVSRGHTVFVKPIDTRDVEIKARIASRFDELGFIPKFFREQGKEFVAIEALKTKAGYQNIEEAFVKQILARL